VRVVGYYDQPLEVRQKLSITNGLVRFACGIEDTQDILDDVLQALEQVSLGKEVKNLHGEVRDLGLGANNQGLWCRPVVIYSLYAYQCFCPQIHMLHGVPVNV
jgi:hypothetical protein